MAGGFIAGDFGRYCGNSNDVIYLTVVSANSQSLFLDKHSFTL